VQGAGVSSSAASWENAHVRRLPVVLAGVAVLAGTLWLYAPALRFELIGDDYQWMQLARAALHWPALLLADLDTFWRPSSTWTLTATHLAAPFSPAAHHAVSLALHVGAALLLLAVARKAGLGWTSATAVAGLWACSPFASEPAIFVASRHETLLLAAWLALALVWPRTGGAWSPGRIAGAAAATALAMCSKETWVVTPGIVFAYEIVIRKGSRRTTVRIAGLFAGLAAVYTLVRFLIFPTLRSYFDLSPGVFAKLPHELAAFLYLEGLMPIRFPFGWRNLLALFVIGAAAAFAIRRRQPAAILGLAFLLLPTIPTLLVPYLPTRYTTIPYCGFLLLVAGCLAELVRALPAPTRRWANGACITVGALVLTAGVFMVRGELADAEGVSRLHASLLSEAREVATAFPVGVPVLVIRAENDNPAETLALGARGLPKLPYIRRPDPYGMVDAAGLFDWVLRREDLEVVRIDDGERRFAGRPGAVLVHRSGRFEWLPGGTSDVGARAKGAGLAGYQVRIVLAEPWRARPRTGGLRTEPPGGAVQSES
jgi:hypothetical protein